MKKKIIEVSSDTNIGGAGKCLLTLLENFNYDEFEVKTILPKNSLLKPHMEKMGATVIEVEGIADKSLDFGAVSELRKIFKSEKLHRGGKLPYLRRIKGQYFCGEGAC